MNRSSLSLLVIFGLMGAVLAPTMKADPVYKRTEVTFRQAVEIPGMVLMPGSYVMKLLDPYMNRNIVRFYNTQENRMYAMVFAVPAYRLTPVEHTVITFEERAHNSPPAIKEWFPAGENWGEEFVYPKPHLIATVTEPTIPQQPQPQATALAPAQVSSAKPETAPVPVVPIQPKEPVVEIAQTKPAPEPNVPATPAVPSRKELPKTASNLPIETLFGGVLVLAGAILRRRIA